VIRRRDRPGRRDKTCSGRSVDESPKADVHHQAQRQKHKHRGRTAVTHERQGNAGHRHIPDDHGHVHQYVETHHRRHTHDQKHPGAILGALSVLDHSQQQSRVQQQGQKHAGETRFFRSFSIQLNEDIEALVEAALFLSRRKIGALVAIEREVGLGGIAESGTRINADLSAAMLNTIFWPNSPLHDLGVIVSQGRIMYAGVQFPLAESGDLERELGSRHRAAVGMSQESDAVVLVVSEQTGDISIADRGQLLRRLSGDQLRTILSELLGGKQQPKKVMKAAALL